MHNFSNLKFIKKYSFFIRFGIFFLFIHFFMIFQYQNHELFYIDSLSISILFCEINYYLKIHRIYNSIFEVIYFILHFCFKRCLHFPPSILFFIVLHLFSWSTKLNETLETIWPCLSTAGVWQLREWKFEIIILHHFYKLTNRIFHC